MLIIKQTKSIIAFLIFTLFIACGGSSKDDKKETLPPKPQTPFSIESVYPSNDSKDIVLDTKITIYLSNVVDITTATTNQISLFNGSNIKVPITVSPNGKQIIIKPQQPLEGLSLYKINLNGLKDSSGNILPLYSFSFKTAKAEEKAKPLNFDINLSKTTAMQGESIDFKITNITGNPTAYQWTSNIDGELSTQQSFSKNNLSIGIHTITLKVTDATESKTETKQLTIIEKSVISLNFDIKLSKTIAMEGERIDFSIINVSGNPTTYKWSSNINGVLNTQQNFSKKDLSAGTHTITLKVTNATENKTKITTLTINKNPIAQIVNSKPSTPTNIKANATPNSLRLSWDKSTDTDGVVVGYEIAYKESLSSGDYSNWQVTSKTTYTIDNLKADELYLIKIRSKDNKGGYSDEGLKSFSTAPPNQQPSKPTNLQATTITINSIALSWDAATDSDGHIVAYELSYKLSSDGNYSNPLTIGKNLTYEIKRLKPDSSYDIRVRAKDNKKAYSNYATLTQRTKAKPRSKIKQTGQTKMHRKYDDGYYKKGIVPSYTRSNNIVTDNFTNLQWQDDSSAKTTKKNFSDAKDSCSNLSLGEYDDWRLPNKKELMGIINYGKSNPSIDPMFQNTAFQKIDFYWSSTKDVQHDSYAWIVSFSNGGDKDGTKSDSHFVRCVRYK